MVAWGGCGVRVVEITVFETTCSTGLVVERQLLSVITRPSLLVQKK